MIDLVKNEFFGKYATFTGKTNRKDFWLTVLGVFLLSIVVGFVLGFVGGLLGDSAKNIFAIILWLYELALIIPCLAIEVRRLHDTGRSGWWILICLVPFVGSIILLVFLCMDSK